LYDPQLQAGIEAIPKTLYRRTDLWDVDAVPGNLPYDVGISSLDSSLKRRRSEEDAGYKRQRIGSGTGAEADVHAQSQPSNLTANSGLSSYYDQRQNGSTLQHGTASQLDDFWDPHRNMRINSLQILNNLVWVSTLTEI
jgi:hypothetical protein